MIRQTANILEGEPAKQSEAKLRARAPDARVAAFLGEIIQAHVSASDDVQLQAARRDPMLMGDQMQRAFVDFVDAECRERPLVMVLEDLQWGDLPSVTAIDAVLRALAERPLTVIGLARPEVSRDFPSLWADRGVQPIPLAPLSKRAAERLVRDVLTVAPPERRRCDSSKAPRATCSSSRSCFARRSRARRRSAGDGGRDGAEPARRARAGGAPRSARRERVRRNAFGGRRACAARRRSRRRSIARSTSSRAREVL